MTKLINTDEMSTHLRGRSIDLAGGRVLITRLAGSDQEQDISEPVNCNGYGRVRHFKLSTSEGWPSNPLPIVPALKALALSEAAMVRAQVFQNAACNWRCWYCYVPYNLLTADTRRAEWMTAGDLVALYLAEPDRPQILDLSGGSPDLVPEWIPWMMRALGDVGASSSVYLWSDDNLSTEYLFDLPAKDLELIRSYRNYGRVCCFKGFNEDSFVFNTGAAAEGYDKQFKIMSRLLALGIDLYGYVTLTCPSNGSIKNDIAAFVDRLQAIHQNLPLRIVPLEIKPFTPMNARLTADRRNSISFQQDAIQAWNGEMEHRFDAALRQLPIPLVSLF